MTERPIMFNGAMDELDHRQGVGATIAEAVQDAIEGYGP